MLPLGGRWDGLCCAATGEAYQPLREMLRTCNLGYARETCARFPMACGPDAVRFAVRGDDGVTLSVSYALERDHRPFEHGVLEYSLTRDEIVSPCRESLRHQAEAYARSYARRRALAGD